MKTILLTGAAGFIGFHTAKAMLEKGDKVIGIDNLNDYYDPKLKLSRLKILKKYKNFKFYKKDIKTPLEIPEKNKINAICHLAAQAGVRYSIENPRAYETSNMLGTLNILEFARNNKIKSVVFASSSSVYGNSKEIPFKESQKLDEPISLYAATKKANELYAYTYFHLYNINMIGLRFFTVYGPWGRPDMALFKFTQSILNNKPIEVFNNGDLKRDFTYVDDIVQGILASIDKLTQIDNQNLSNIRIINNQDSKSSKKLKKNSSSLKLVQQPCLTLDTNKSSPSFTSATNNNPPTKFFEIFNLGRGEPVQLTDFIKEIESATKKQAKLKMMPMQKGDVSVTFADTSKAKAVLGYEPKTSINKGIVEFVKWYKEYYKIK